VLIALDIIAWIGRKRFPQPTFYGAAIGDRNEHEPLSFFPFGPLPKLRSMWDARAMKYLLIDVGPIYRPMALDPLEVLGFFGFLVAPPPPLPLIFLNMSTEFQDAADETERRALAVEWVAGSSRPRWSQPHLTLTKAAYVACLLYDHALTLGQEVCSWQILMT
jgi:hypothetical protein